jgi:Tfp pilus assembly protein PilE
MKKISKNQKGFSVVEAVLMLVIVVLIAVIGYMVYKNGNKTKTSSSNTTVKTTQSSTSKSTTATNPYAGWKQYCSSYEKSCFKYPSTWTFTNSCTSSTPCDGSDNVGVTSPSNSQIGFTSAITGRGGDCANNIDSFVTSVTPLPSVKGLYLVQFNRTDVNFVALGVDDTINGAIPATGDTGSCFMYTQFTAKNTPNAQASLSGQIPLNAKSADLSDAILILNSYYYQ